MELAPCVRITASAKWEYVNSYKEQLPFRSISMLFSDLSITAAPATNILVKWGSTGTSITPKVFLKILFLYNI